LQPFSTGLASKRGSGAGVEATGVWLWFAESARPLMATPPTEKVSERSTSAVTGSRRIWRVPLVVHAGTAPTLWSLGENIVAARFELESRADQA
jgi:hypothetical protein